MKLLESLFNTKKEVEKKKIRIDLIIFGILIYILGMLTGIFVGVGLSEGEISLSTFQRVFSKEDEVVIEDIVDDSNNTASQAIIMNPNTDIKSGENTIMSGGSSVQSGDSSSSVTQKSESGSGGGGEGDYDFSIQNDDNRYVEPSPSDYDD
jgi:hypothetical protein